MEQLQTAVSRHDYERAARLARENIRQVPSLVRAWTRDSDGFSIVSIPAFEVGGTMLALAGDVAGLAEMRSVARSCSALDPWKDAAELHEEDLRLFAAILAVVGQNPGCLQSDMKALVGAADGRRVATLIAWLEKAGKLTREKQGKTYALWIPGAPGAVAPPPKREVASHRTDRKRPPLREIDVAKLPYVPLPRAPLQWEEAQLRGTQAWVPEPTSEFEVRDADGWEIATVEKIPPGERPDPAFRQLHPLNSGLVMIDDLGKAEGFGPVPAAALRYGRTGEVEAKGPLLHDTYRVGVNPMGHGLIALSREAVLHAYDDALELILETPLADDPEIRALRERFEIRDDSLKNHIRAVALSPAGDRYLFTAVDEAWCVGMEGKGRWGVKLPLKEGWTRISEPGDVTGTSEDARRALSLMGMTYPFTPEDLKSSYRRLAKQWHPDTNPGDPSAKGRFQELSAAMELLTGLDPKSLGAYTGVRYAREMSRSEIEVDGVRLSMSIGMVVGEIQAADWVYAASFAGWSNSVFLAGYSGRVIEVSEEGEPVRAYDIGSVPRRIVDTGDFLYILTGTRLYVLKGETLHALIDTFEGGELVTAQTGFGLLEKKRFRWFRENGEYLGSVVTKAPIRRVYASAGGITVETRTRRAFVRGAPAWWEEVRDPIPAV